MNNNRYAIMAERIPGLEEAIDRSCRNGRISLVDLRVMPEEQVAVYIIDRLATNQDRSTRIYAFRRGREGVREASTDWFTYLNTSQRFSQEGGVRPSLRYSYIVNIEVGERRITRYLGLEGLEVERRRIRARVTAMNGQGIETFEFDI